MWTSEIITKNIVNGLLKVEVKFTKDDGTNFIDRYETRSEQDSNWLINNIKRRLTELETIQTFADNIPLGIIDVNVEPTTTVTNTPVSEYKLKLDEFNKMVEFIKKGIITENNLDFIETKQWLKDNFSKDKINLF